LAHQYRSPDAYLAWFSSRSRESAEPYNLHYHNIQRTGENNMRLPLCIALLCVSIIVSFGQSTIPPGKGLSDTLTPDHPSTPISNYNVSLWSTSNADTKYKMVPNKTFQQFGPFPDSVTMPDPQKSRTYLYVIHVADWSAEPIKDASCTDSKASTSASTFSFMTSDWYVYRNTGTEFVNIPFDGKSMPPIYGMTNIVLLSVSRISVANCDKIKAPFLQYSAVPTESTAPNEAALEALASAVLNVSLPKSETRAPKINLTHTPPSYNYSIQVFKVSANPLHAPFNVAFTATATKDDPEAAVQSPPKEPMIKSSVRTIYASNGM
jgi:hypothetical protein